MNMKLAVPYILMGVGTVALPIIIFLQGKIDDYAIAGIFWVVVLDTCALILTFDYTRTRLFQLLRIPL